MRVAAILANRWNTRTRGGARMIGAMRDLRHMYCCMYNLVCMHAAHSDTQNTPEA